MKIFSFLKELLFPTNLKCIVCNEEMFTNNDFCICENCLKNLPVVTKPCSVCGRQVVGEGKLCNHCTNEKITLTLARAPLLYNKDMHNLITNLKYKNCKYLAKPLGKLLYNYYIHSEDFKDINIIIPVPIYETRLKKRGYNQTELLLNNFEEKDKIDFTLVSKIKDTGSQTDKTYGERLAALTDAFIVNDKTKIKNKNILIVDDVFTTGATCNSLAKTLLKAGAKSVKALTLCNVIYKKDIKENEKIEIKNFK